MEPITGSGRTLLLAKSNGNRNQDNRLFIPEITRSQNIIPTSLVVLRKQNQMKLIWNTSLPYWNHSLTQGQCQHNITTEKNLKLSALENLIITLYSKTVPSTKRRRQNLITKQQLRCQCPNSSVTNQPWTRTHWTAGMKRAYPKYNKFWKWRKSVQYLKPGLEPSSQHGARSF